MVSPKRKFPLNLLVYLEISTLLFPLDKNSTWSLNLINDTQQTPYYQIEYLLGSVGNRQFETEALFKTNVYPRKSKFKYNELPSLEESFNDYKTFSIDPVGCKDIDDALHYKELDNGKKEIGIHIANVARYVDSWETNFFSSVYLKEKQINMLDESLSFERCSLGHGEKKRALSLILTFDDFVLENMNLGNLLLGIML